MPTTAQAAIVFLVIALPGFLAEGGYRLGRAVPEHPQGLVAVARVIALSTLIGLIAWKLGGRALYQHARAGDALTSEEADTYWFAVGLFVIPPVVGYLLGQAIDFFARGVGTAIDHLPEAPDPGAPQETFGRPLADEFLARSISACSTKDRQRGIGLGAVFDATSHSLTPESPLAAGGRSLALSPTHRASRCRRSRTICTWSRCFSLGTMGATTQRHMGSAHSLQEAKLSP